MSIGLFTGLWIYSIRCYDLYQKRGVNHENGKKKYKYTNRKTPARI